MPFSYKNQQCKMIKSGTKLLSDKCGVPKGKRGWNGSGQMWKITESRRIPFGKDYTWRYQ